jgi:hypothetical protein
MEGETASRYINRMARKHAQYAEDITGKTFVIIGDMVHWPIAIGGPPEAIIPQRGGILQGKLTAETDYLVLSPARAAGKAKAQKHARKLQEAGARLAVIDDAQLAHLLRPRLDAATFYIAGGFDCAPGGDGPTHPRTLVGAVGGVVHEVPGEETQFAVIGDRRAAGKAEAERLIAPLVAAGILVRLSEAAFLELVALHRPPGKDDGLSGLFIRLQTLFESGKIERALKMLKKERMHLFADVTPGRILGIVQSQRSNDVYACYLSADGNFGCRMMSLESCMGQGGATGQCRGCKHLLVLVIGLVNEGLLKSSDAEQWLAAATGKGISRDKEMAAEAILKYKGVQAGEVDWRPIETVPEDYYAL